MKFDPKLPELDNCQTSIDILKERSARWLTSNFSCESIWFPDHHTPYVKPHTEGQPLDIVLFGGFFKRILESGNWPRCDFRLWVLSPSVRNVLTRLMGFPEEAIAVIPRYSLFPISEGSSPLPTFGEEMTWVVAGRISPTKNIASILYTVHYLQVLHGLPIQLILQGDFDDQIHSDWGRRDEVSFKDVIEPLIESLDWTLIPRILPKVSSDQWLDTAHKNPVLVSFSTFMCEDFNVSLAQAQEKGWPCLISDWGGNQEAVGGSVVKISPAWIAHSHEPPAVISLKSRTLAGHLSRLFKSKNIHGQTKHQDKVANLPQPLSAARMDELRRDFVERMGPSIQSVLKNGIEVFADTDSGKSFFNEYRLNFSAPPPSSAVCFFINDLSDEIPETKRILTLCESWIQHCDAAGKDLLFFSTRAIKTRQCLMALSHASQIVVPFHETNHLSLVQFLQASVGQTPVTGSPFAAARAKEPEIIQCRVISDSMSPIIRTGDVIQVSIHDARPLQRFDIIVYFRNGIPTCHFVWHINRKLGKGQIIMRSLKHHREDEPPLNPSLVLGRVLNFRLSFWLRVKLLLAARASFHDACR